MSTAPSRDTPAAEDDGFGGAEVVSFESRMAEATARLIERCGGHPRSAPSMQEVPLSDHSDVFAFAERLFGGDVDVLVCNTGVGTRMLVETMQERYDYERICEALRGVQIVARGPKPTRVLRQHDLPIDASAPEPNTWKELLSELAARAEAVPVDGRCVAIQEYGQPNDAFNEALRARGARLLRVPIYRWALPDDRAPLKAGLRALADGTAAVAMFTSRTQIDHVMKMAAQENGTAEVRAGLERAWIASVGPVCSRGLREHGLHVDFEPERPKLAILIRGAARAFARQLLAGA